MEAKIGLDLNLIVNNKLDENVTNEQKTDTHINKGIGDEGANTNITDMREIENTQLITTQNENDEYTNLKERIRWALTKPEAIVKQSDITIAQQKKEAQEKEKKWGNEMIRQTNNGQWTTLLGEKLVYDVLQLRGENPRKVVRRDGFEPDWETDEYMYEVKTSNWWVSGTAGEKVYGTFIKYQNIPELYGKPLKIVCVAYQEEELTNGKTKYFGDNITKKTQEILDIAKSWGIEYIRFSDLVSPILDKII